MAPLTALTDRLPTWSQTKTGSKAGFDKVYTYVDKLGKPINNLSNKVGSEAFWPTTLDKESDKAARILRSFCKDGFYVQQENDGHATMEGKPKGHVRVLKKIPTEVIKKAKGLAIFTTMRTGLWISGAGGSGVLMAKLPNGDWSPPSGILLHTAGLGFLIGVDIYDCVVVINTEKALEAFTKIRCTLGGEISATAGPVGMGGLMETEIHKRQAPVWNYLKSRGFYAGVQIDGTVIIQRQDENTRFYGEKLGVDEILKGKAKRVPPETRTLMMTLRSAQGDTDIDESSLPPSEPTPGDFEVGADDSKRFGLPPSDDDPDPYGVKALEEEGMEIREISPTGHKSRPSVEAFEYKPAPSSPIFTTFSVDGSLRRHSKKNSVDSGRLSISSMDRGTQTDPALDSPRFAESPKGSGHHSPVKKTTENLAEEPEEPDEDSYHEDHPATTAAMATTATRHTPVIIEKAKLVTIPKRVPPALPPRSPYRASSSTSPFSERPTSPLAFEHDMTIPDAGLAIGHEPTEQPRVTEPEEARSNKDDSKEAEQQTLEPIHLTQTENSRLEEQLSHIHTAPAYDAHRLTPNRADSSTNTANNKSTTADSTSGITTRTTSRDDVRSIQSGSSYYSRGGSPPDATPSEAMNPSRLGEAETSEAVITPLDEGQKDGPKDGPKDEPPKNTHTEPHPSEPVSTTISIPSTEKEKEKEKDEFHSMPSSPTVEPAELKKEKEHEKADGDEFT